MFEWLQCNLYLMCWSITFFFLYFKKLKAWCQELDEKFKSPWCHELWPVVNANTLTTGSKGSLKLKRKAVLSLLINPKTAGWIVDCNWCKDGNRMHYEKKAGWWRHCGVMPANLGSWRRCRLWQVPPKVVQVPKHCCRPSDDDPLRFVTCFRSITFPLTVQELFRNIWMNLTKSSRCCLDDFVLQIPQISISSSVCRMCWKNKLRTSRTTYCCWEMRIKVYV